jgi:hypothetical protein
MAAGKNSMLEKEGLTTNSPPMNAINTAIPCGIVNFVSNSNFTHTYRF